MQAHAYSQRPDWPPIFSPQRQLRVQRRGNRRIRAWKHRVETIARPFNRRPTLGLGDWGLSPLLKLGRPEAAATFVGALARGAFAEVNNFPGVDAARARILERARAVLGDDTTDTCVARGAAMSYDDIVEYAYRHLEPLDAPEH